MPVSLLPRPSVVTSVVVAMSVAGGLAAGVLAASAALVAYRLGKGRG